MQFISVLNFIQHNPWIYTVVSAFITVILVFIQDKIKNKFKNPSRNKRIRSGALTFIISVILEVILYAYATFFPYQEENIIYNGNLKLSFYNGAVSFRDAEDYEIICENDVVNIQHYSYLDDPISPIVYITITDLNGTIIKEVKSESLSECIIPLEYGDYILTASCDNYVDYKVEISLRSDNKKANIWRHNIHLIPDLIISKDLRVQVADSNGNPLSNTKVEFGYIGYQLLNTTDNDGFLTFNFTLTKGEYAVYLPEKKLSGRFVVNELTEDNQTIKVLLMPT